MRKIPIIICIDVEPDERQIDSARDWEGFEETFGFFNNLRFRLEEATGSPARFSWFFRMDPQIKHVYGRSSWVAERYGEAIKQLESAGDEL